MAFSIEQIVSRLRINKHCLDDELEIQAQITHDIAELLAKANEQLLGFKDAMDQVEAEIRLELRNGEVKYSNDVIEAEIITNGKRRIAFRAYKNQKREVETLNGLFEAWKSRGFSLKSLSDLYHADYFAVDSAGKRENYQSDREAIGRNRRPLTKRRVVVGER